MIKFSLRYVNHNVNGTDILWVEKHNYTGMIIVVFVAYQKASLIRSGFCTVNIKISWLMTYRKP